MESVFALFSEHTLGWQARETGIFLTFLGVLMALVQGWLVGRAVDGVGEAWTLTLGIVGLGLGLGWLAGIPYAPEWLGIALHEADGSMSGACVGLVAVGAAAIALGNGLVMAPTSALVARTSRTEEVGLNMGLKESAGALARITGPVLAGVLFEVYHPSTPLFVGALLCAANLLLAARLRRGLRREAAAGALSP
jgi:MFS family permease